MSSVHLPQLFLESKLNGQRLVLTTTSSSCGHPKWPWPAGSLIPLTNQSTTLEWYLKAAICTHTGCWSVRYAEEEELIVKPNEQIVANYEDVYAAGSYIWHSIA